MNKLYYREILNSNLVVLFDNFIGTSNNILDNLYFNQEYKYTRLDELARALDLDIKKEALPSMQSGSLDGTTVIVNSTHHIHRQRFSIAHEIGHYLFQHKGTLLRTIDFSMYTDSKDYQNELEANDFAAKLLMPLKLINKYLETFRNNYQLQEEDIIDGEILENLLEELSNKLKVSRVSLERRLKDLGILNYE